MRRIGWLFGGTLLAMTALGLFGTRPAAAHHFGHFGFGFFGPAVYVAPPPPVYPVYVEPAYLPPPPPPPIVYGRRVVVRHHYRHVYHRVAHHVCHCGCCN